MAVLGSDKSRALFKRMRVLSDKEIDARVTVSHRHYTEVVLMEAQCMSFMLRSMLSRPSDRGFILGHYLKNLNDEINKLKEMHEHGADHHATAAAARVLRLDVMVGVRKKIDELEDELRACGAMSYPSYENLLFLDNHDDAAAAAAR